ncbi:MULTISPECIES: porin [Maritimibacter]|jgi:outer membrane protein OmpU|uniref:Putative porin n=1 Tax=Maritimibacter alkaliphilus HTCC2654 TaxID=314271 RepID=A3VML1_9RHOB|nr:MULTISPECIES: porin [Maritimibacter]EAQ10513.1 putative porin [Rhodobacterales bacterium HTCC2654] [Maritimibacter alkaliphilus HTCC2654]MBL6427522.1 porin [Maritimibacter sp.]TYP84493.1 porin-like protein [Maritimibacter alkaliphilus HTCC2654]
MKKILLASTVLVGTTGFAAADVSFTGRAYAGLGYNITTGTLLPELSALFTAGMMTTTDQGLEAGASVTVLAAGQSMQKDPSDAQFGTNDWPPAAGVVLGANVYLSGSWGKVAVAYDTNADGDATTPGDQDITVTYTNTWGNFGLSAFGVLVAPGSTATTNGDLGVKGTYSFGDYSVWAAVERDANDADGNTIDLKAGVSASISGFTAAAEIKYDLGNATPFSWAASAGYATGPYSISAFFNSDMEYGGKAAYDLGGGVAIEAGFAHSNGVNSPVSNVVWAGVSMAF